MFARLITVAIALTAAQAAFAQGTPAQRAACRPDVVKFCKGKGEDPGVLLQCLEDNKDKIAEKCRVVINEVNGTTPAGAKKQKSPASLPQKNDDKPAEAKEENKQENKQENKEEKK